MNILFIHSDTLEKNIYKVSKEKPLYANDEIQFGISYISAMLKNNNHHIDLFIISKKTRIVEIEQVVERCKPDLICLSAVFREYESIVNTANKLKATYPNTYLLGGGPHITLNPEVAIQEAFDAICIGEGEFATLELVDQLEKDIKPHGIQNLWIKQDASIERNPTRKFCENLDVFPFPDRQMWQKYITNPKTPHVILVGRGCPFDCTYCCNHALREVAEGRYVRFRSPENVIEEVDQVIKQFAENDTIYFEVEAININVKYLEYFCTKLEEYNKTLKRDVFYGVNFRIISSQDVNHIFHLLRKANITYLNIGLESGSERIRQEMMKRNYSNDDVRQVVKLAKRYRILSMLYVMLGIPTETVEDFHETVNLVKECQPHFAQLNIFCPYPGTYLYEYCLEHNLIKPSFRDHGRNVAVLDYPQFSAKEIQKQYYLFYPEVYAKNKGHRFILTILSYLVQKWNFTFLYDFAIKFMRSPK
ncbi:MAG: B12-binding domain-containing radical SAM protein [Halanaerobiales bacterium]|nr:B12-binding domain-containing radical SAM protein [Halanaerobiales bacterium]